MDPKKYRRLALSELEKNAAQTSVWVFNMTGTTDAPGAEKRGSINLSVNDGMGNIIPVRIPITWVPVDITTQATKSSILANPQFRRLVSSGALKLISEEDAQTIVNTPEGIKETRRIYSTDGFGETNVPQEIQEQLNVQQGNISPIVISVIQRDDLDEESCMSVLRSHEMTLSPEDCEYLASNSKHSRVKEWAISKLS